MLLRLSRRWFDARTGGLSAASRVPIISDAFNRVETFRRTYVEICPTKPCQVRAPTTARSDPQRGGLAASDAPLAAGDGSSKLGLLRAQLEDRVSA